MTRGSFVRTLLLCLQPFVLAVVVSSLSVLYQAMKSVPGLLGVRGLWSRVLSYCVGAIQGVVGGFILPKVGKKLSGIRLSFLAIAGFVTTCVLPAAVVIFLDTYCLGGWPVFWGPCRHDPEQFNRRVDLEENVGEALQHSIQILRSIDICDWHQARAQTSLSKCIQVVLLRLQELWLPKLITSGVVIPACRLAIERHYKDSTQVVNAFIVFVAYLMITVGHLPLVMPILWFSMLSTILLAAVSWHNHSMCHNLEEKVLGPK